MKNLVVVAMGRNTSLAFREQLYRLLGNRVNINNYSMEGSLPTRLTGDVVLFSSQEVYSRAKRNLDPDCPTLVARRSIDYHEVHKLFEIPDGTDVLLVNDLISSTYQTIALLQTLGIDHINYHPYAPQMSDFLKLKIAVTPGEKELVPDFVEQVVDIKTRLIDITTVVELLRQLELLDVYADFLSANYVKDIIRLTKNWTENMLEVQRLGELVRHKLLKEQKVARYTLSQIVGQSPAICSTLAVARKMANSDSTILIQGESGTGKEMVAQGIHNESPRRDAPFIAVNFAALTENLLESELFGYVEGAFTGAARGGAPGLFEEAHKGTIFLDEVGDAPLTFQVKLLRVLQEQQIRRVGSAKVIPIDVRVIAATNRDLKELIDAGLFRRDLYYRLNVLPIKVPPLRSRGEDTLLLAKKFYGTGIGRGRKLTTDGYFQWLAPYFLQYDWPGNIRELQNVVEYLMNVCPDTAPLPQMLPEEIYPAAQPNSAALEMGQSLQQRIYQVIEAANRQDVSIGRRSLAERLQLPENQIREAVRQLQAMGLILQQRGRKGLKVLPPVTE